MSLSIAWTREETVGCLRTREALKDGLSHGGRAVLLVPDFRRQVDASRSLADGGFSLLGVTVSTPSAWVGERWEVWGDGTRVIDRTTRVAAMQRTLARVDPDRPGGIGDNPGTVDALCSLASLALPWLPLGDGDPARSEAGLTGAECATLSLVGDYARAIHAMGFVEGSEAMARVAGAMGEQGVTVPPVVFDGFREFPRSLRELALGLAAACDVTVAAHLPNEFAAEGLRRDLGMLLSALGDRGLANRVLKVEGDGRYQAVERPRELGEVL